MQQTTSLLNHFVSIVASSEQSTAFKTRVKLPARPTRPLYSTYTIGLNVINKIIIKC